MGQAPPRQIALSDLTVPAERRPADCGLADQLEAAITGRPKPNPWIGTDRSILASLRQKVDGVPRTLLPDLPPMPREEPGRRLQLADGVEEGYAATYEWAVPASATRVVVFVRAVRFTETPAPILDFPTPHPPTYAPFDLGRVRIAVDGGSNPCARAIDTYLRGLAK